MIQLLELVRRHGHEKLQEAVETGMELGCYDSGAIRHLVCAAELSRTSAVSLEIPELSRFERPLPAVTDYDLLLTGETPNDCCRSD